MAGSRESCCFFGWMLSECGLIYKEVEKEGEEESDEGTLKPWTVCNLCSSLINVNERPLLFVTVRSV